MGALYGLLRDLDRADLERILIEAVVAQRLHQINEVGDLAWIDDAEPIDATRQQPVHDDDVITLAGRQEHAGAAVIGVIDRMPVFAKAADGETGVFDVVLDDQQSHLVPPWRLTRETMLEAELYSIV